MDFIDDLATAARYSAAAMRLMEERQVPATPENFSVWYAHASGRNPELSKALDAAAPAGQPVPSSIISDIHDRYLGGEAAGDAMVEAGESLSGVAEDLMKMVSQANDDVAVFSDALANSAGSLAGVTDPTAVGRIVKALAENTQHMIGQNAALQYKLEDSSKEVATLKQNLESAQKEAMTDGLTGIPNRKCFDIALRRAVDQARKSSAPLCVVMTDIDHFKKFNDTHGHQTGDHVLRFVATMLQRSVKAKDTAARYGGEEFGVILPGTGLNAATAIAESVRSMVAGKHLRKKQTGAVIGNITLSLGVARYHDGEPAASFLKRADDGLYMAKRLGRNQVVDETQLDAAAD